MYVIIATVLVVLIVAGAFAGVYLSNHTNFQALQVLVE